LRVFQQDAKDVLNRKNHVSFDKFIEVVDIIDTPHLFLVEIIGALASAISVGIWYGTSQKERSFEGFYQVNLVT